MMMMMITLSKVKLYDDHLLTGKVSLPKLPTIQITFPLKLSGVRNDGLLSLPLMLLSWFGSCSWICWKSMIHFSHLLQIQILSKYFLLTYRSITNNPLTTCMVLWMTFFLREEESNRKPKLLAIICDDWRLIMIRTTVIFFVRRLKTICFCIERHHFSLLKKTLTSFASMR
jgi:hypothetical protein